MSLITIIDTIIWSEVKEIADMVLITPPPILGGFYSWGTPPDPRQEVSCTTFSAIKKVNNVASNRT